MVVSHYYSPNRYVTHLLNPHLGLCFVVFNQSEAHHLPLWAGPLRVRLAAGLVWMNGRERPVLMSLILVSHSIDSLSERMRTNLVPSSIPWHWRTFSSLDLILDSLFNSSSAEITSQQECYGISEACTPTWMLKILWVRCGEHMNGLVLVRCVAGASCRVAHVLCILPWLLLHVHHPKCSATPPQNVKLL